MKKKQTFQPHKLIKRRLNNLKSTKQKNPNSTHNIFEINQIKCTIEIEIKNNYLNSKTARNSTQHNQKKKKSSLFN